MTTASFRLAEDRTPTDLDDDAYPLPSGALIGVAHPAMLHDDLTRWAAIFADYEIMQSFPQIGAVVPPLTDEERAGPRLSRFEGSTVPTRALSSLLRRGWHRAEEGPVTMFHRPVAADRRVEIWLDPGYTPGASVNAKEQTLREVRLVCEGTPLSEVRTEAEHAVTQFNVLDEVDCHKIVYDLTQLAR
ncbi:DUF4132 domain-containing protein [Actinoalloteichus hymeniacidonis]|uniref:DUF4132 family protein n=1 Tax=Actinoalloteichus hymeniacidonis TaxID=340345 RepID=A0AAC9HSW5_9PSEU|nr:DUF4132 domain-containing protein [Actinoalloteichus hymeniacidonis]AOS63875.1 putative DUF4132 family protein [Actinoalloteichus hymeniacidonis]MBB5908069.1 hypothetical protein [Actinoalloteichus hymeniacidonis]